MVKINCEMQAFKIITTDGHRKLELGKYQIPEIAENQVLIKTYASGVNRADLFQVEGSYPAPLGASEIPGLEVAGTIAQLGAKVKSWQIDDKVCALLAGGGYAEYVAVECSLLLPIPNKLNFIQAASLPEAIYTVYFNLVTKASIKAGDILLIHGAASGIGSYAIQIAKSLGAKVIVTVSSDEKCQYCKNLGADLAINYNKQDIVATIKSSYKSVDIVLDMFGGKYLQSNISVLGYKGRLIIISLLKGASQEINFGAVLMKNLTIMGSTLRSQAIEVKQELTREIAQVIWPLIEQEKIRPMINKVFSLQKAAEAHDYMRSNQHQGKIMLQVKNN